MNKTPENIATISPFHIVTISLFKWLSLLAEIVKIKITVLVSLTTALGYILGTDNISLHIFYPVLGIFILACGSAALNQYQERSEDALMNRTKSRPLPSGRISPGNVLTISLILLFLGSTILILKTNVLTLEIGLLAFFWYNAVYTPLKKKMVFAIIPGSIVGALPPLAGWAATGHSIFELNILFVAIYFFVWQIPHFWLLLLIYGKDYDRGGFPILTNILSEKKIVLITFILLIATVSIAGLLPVFNLIHFAFSEYVLWGLCLLMFVLSLQFLFAEQSNKKILKTFVSINIFTLLIITLFSLDKFIYIKF